MEILSIPAVRLSPKVRLLRNVISVVLAGVAELEVASSVESVSGDEADVVAVVSVLDALVSSVLSSVPVSVAEVLSIVVVLV